MVNPFCCGLFWCDPLSRFSTIRQVDQSFFLKSVIFWWIKSDTMNSLDWTSYRYSELMNKFFFVSIGIKACMYGDSNCIDNIDNKSIKFSFTLFNEFFDALSNGQRLSLNRPLCSIEFWWNIRRKHSAAAQKKPWMTMRDINGWSSNEFVCVCVCM